MSNVNTTHLNVSINKTKEIMKSELRKVSAVVPQDILERIALENKMNPNSNERNRDSILSYSFVDKNIKNDIQTGRKNLKKRTSQRKKTSSIPKNVIDKETIYERSVKAKAKHDKRVETKKTLLKFDQISKMKTHPEICEMSKKILSDNKEKLNNLPFHLRIEKILENKEKKLKLLESKFKTKQATPDLQTKANSNNFDNWLIMNEVWKQNQEAKLAYLKKEYQELEEQEEGCIFTPSIDRKSDEIVKWRNKERNKSCFDLLHSKHNETQSKLEELRNSSLPTFRPIINGKSRILARNRYNYSILNNSPKQEEVHMYTENKSKHHQSRTSFLHKKSKSQCDLSSHNLIELIPHSSLYKINVYNDSSWKFPLASLRSTETNSKFVMSTLANYV